MIIILLIISLASSVDVTNKCQCSQLTYENDCKQNFWCYWRADLAQCVYVGACASVQTQNMCVQKVECAFYDGKCQDFISCSKFKGSKTDCENISELCTSFDGTNCVDLVLPLCKAYPEDDCDTSFGSDGECIWLNNQCQVLEKCSDIGSNIIKCYGNIHSCKPENGGCVDRKCSHYQTSSDCTVVHAYDPKDIVKNVTICQWNAGQCIDATPDYLSDEDCYYLMEQSYRWNETSKKCEQCPSDVPQFEQIVKALILLIVIMQ